MIPRSITPYLREMIGKYPVITLTGPRQGGKTTLLKKIFPDMPFVSLEVPSLREKVQENPLGLFTQYGNKLVIDEIQRVPLLLSYIQDIVDNDPEAFFVVSGSHNLLMLENVSQTLAGRTAIFYLLPFSIQELQLPNNRYEDWIFNGFYPRIYASKLPPSRFYQDYIDTYVQRDVRQIKSIGNLNLFNRFLGLCAGHIGQTVNYSNMANSIGVSVNTVISWLSVLEASYVLFQLNPYFRNFNKRVVKAPKLYFYDTGLACSLLRLTSAEGLETYYQKGALFENLIISEICKFYYNRGEKPPIYYWRDHKGHEIDVLIDQGTQLLPIELKSSRTFSIEFAKNLNWWQKVVNVPTGDSYIIYGGDQDWEMEGGKLLSWKHLADLPL